MYYFAQFLVWKKVLIWFCYSFKHFLVLLLFDIEHRRFERQTKVCFPCGISLHNTSGSQKSDESLCTSEVLSPSGLDLSIFPGSSQSWLSIFAWSFCSIQLCVYLQQAGSSALSTFVCCGLDQIESKYRWNVFESSQTSWPKFFHEILWRCCIAIHKNKANVCTKCRGRIWNKLSMVSLSILNEFLWYLCLYSESTLCLASKILSLLILSISV